MNLGIADITGDVGRNRRGPGHVQMQALQNVRVGFDDIQVGYVFQYEGATGTSIRDIRVYLQAGTGYAGGNGGNIEATLRTWNASGADPEAGTALAQGWHSPGLTSNSGSFFPSISLNPVSGQTATLTHGQVYVITFRNVHAAPTSNYISLNGCQVNNRGRPMPYTSTDAWAFWVKLRGVWRNMSTPHVGDGTKNYVPILEYQTSAGTYHGKVCMESGAVITRSNGGTPTMRPVGPNQAMRSIVYTHPGYRGEGGYTMKGVTVSCGIRNREAAVDVWVYQGTTLRYKTRVTALVKYPGQTVRGDARHWTTTFPSSTLGFCEQLVVPFEWSRTIDMSREWSVRIRPVSQWMYFTSYRTGWDRGFRSEQGTGYFSPGDDGSDAMPTDLKQYNGNSTTAVGDRWVWCLQLHT